MVIGVAYIYFVHRDDVLYVGGRAVIGLIIVGVLGAVAVGKGRIGLFFGQFLGDED